MSSKVGTIKCKVFVFLFLTILGCSQAGNGYSILKSFTNHKSKAIQRHVVKNLFWVAKKLASYVAESNKGLSNVLKKYKEEINLY